MNKKTFIAKLDTLEDAIAFAENEFSSLSPKALMQITICLEEMFINVANYAYDGKEGEVTIVADLNEKAASLTLIDAGVPFNPLEHKEPDITLDACEREIGGLGIFMVKKYMTELDYKRENEKNIFRMSYGIG